MLSSCVLGHSSLGTVLSSDYLGNLSVSLTENSAFVAILTNYYYKEGLDLFLVFISSGCRCAFDVDGVGVCRL